MRNFENSLALSSKFKERHTWFLVIVFLFTCPRGSPAYRDQEVCKPENTLTWKLLTDMDDVEQKKQVMFVMLFHLWKVCKQAKINYID